MSTAIGSKNNPSKYFFCEMYARLKTVVGSCNEICGKVTKNDTQKLKNQIIGIGAFSFHSKHWKFFFKVARPPCEYFLTEQNRNYSVRSNKQINPQNLINIFEKIEEVLGFESVPRVSRP